MAAPTPPSVSSPTPARGWSTPRPGVAARPGRGAGAPRLAPPPDPSPHAAAGPSGRHDRAAPRGRAGPVVRCTERRRGGAASIAGISRRLRVAAEKLGPTYIKLGQIIASGDGIFPPELVAEFKWCRDQVPAEPWPVVERVLVEELGRPDRDGVRLRGPRPAGRRLHRPGARGHAARRDAGGGQGPAPLGRRAACARTSP